MAWLPFLIGLQGIPHTGALRTLFLLVGIAHVAWLTHSLNGRLSGLDGRSDKIVFWLLTTWLAFQSTFVAAVPSVAIKEFAADWGKLVLMAALGIWLALAAPSRRWVLIAVFSGAFVHVLLTLGPQPITLLSGEGLVYQRSLLADYALTSPFTTVAIAWLLADCSARLWHGRGSFPWSAVVSVILLLMSLSAEALLMAKAGQVMTAVLAVAAGMVMLSAPNLGWRWTVGATAALIVAVTLAGTTTAARWSNLGDSLLAAWSAPVPVAIVVSDDVALPGNLNHSLYLRAVRARVGLEGIAEHPLGLGFDAQVFRRYATDRFGVPEATSSSNSGLIDFALASGIPGLSLLLILAGLLMRRGWTAFVTGRPEGLVLALLVLQHMGRYLLDGTLGGSRFTGMALALGVLWAMSVKTGRSSESR
jgi:hypothetical protein